MKQRILIADDSDILLAFTTVTIEAMGYEVVQAVNGKEAIEKALSIKPDLIILDWKMPVMDGLEVTKNLKSNPETKDIPIIMITGAYDSVEHLAIAMSSGVSEYIRKPFDNVELEARIKSQLKHSAFYKEILSIKNKEVSELAQCKDFHYYLINKLNELLHLSQDKNIKNIISEILERAHRQINLKKH